MGEIKLDGLLCDRCEHTWVSRNWNDERPRVCPRCKSPYWDVPRRNGIKQEVVKVSEADDELFPWKKKGGKSG